MIEDILGAAQEDAKISLEKVKKVVAKMPNWKPPGPDLVQGFWLRNFWSMHLIITHQLETCLQEGEVPAWMTTGRSVLIEKDKIKGKEASNYRPITRLPLMWKLADEIYEFLESDNILQEEQKGCKNNSRGTHGSLFGVDVRIDLLQKSVLLGTPTILRKVLES